MPLHRDTGTRRTRQTPASQSGWVRLPPPVPRDVSFLLRETPVSHERYRDVVGRCRAASRWTVQSDLCLGLGVCDEEGYCDTSFPYCTLHTEARGITPPLSFFFLISDRTVSNEGFSRKDAKQNPKNENPHWEEGTVRQFSKCSKFERSGLWFSPRALHRDEELFGRSPFYLSWNIRLKGKTPKTFVAKYFFTMSTRYG